MEKIWGNINGEHQWETSMGNCRSFREHAIISVPPSGVSSMAGWRIPELAMEVSVAGKIIELNGGHQSCFVWKVEICGWNLR
jgi:hypothetical protein